jgi:hypothetical protein
MRRFSSRRLRSTSLGFGSFGAFASVAAAGDTGGGGGGNGGGDDFFLGANGPMHMVKLPQQMDPNRASHDRDSWIDS